MIEAYLQVLELGYFEAEIAFDGLSDAHIWKRPAPGLLSVGELAGHVVYWEAVRLAGEGGEHPPDLAKCAVKSLLIDHRFGYYPETVATPPSEQHLAMTTAAVCAEFLRVHKEAATHFKARNPEAEATPPGWPPGYTYGQFLRYAAFHVAYHAGQMYSVRHLLGETPPDN